jgi:hypothetical protein
LNKRLEHAFDVTQDVMIPVSDDVISGFFERSRPNGVSSSSLNMLSTIDLQDQLQIQCDEIDDIPGNGLLPFEFGTFEPPIAQLAPHQLLGFSHSVPQRARLPIHGGAPSPNPLPNGERALRAQNVFSVQNPRPIRH